MCFCLSLEIFAPAKRVLNTCSDTVLMVLGAQTRPYLRKSALSQGGELKRWVRGMMDVAFVFGMEARFCLFLKAQTKRARASFPPFFYSLLPPTLPLNGYA